MGGLKQRFATDKAAPDLGAALATRLDKFPPGCVHALISCSKTKGDYRAPAGELYTSALFSKSRRLADACGLSFSILSAKHGLLAPDEIIEPYDLTLKTASKDFKEEWGRRTAKQIEARLSSYKQLIFFAGSDYSDPLRMNIDDFDRRVLLPLDGLSLGFRLSVLDHASRFKTRQSKVGDLYRFFEELQKELGRKTLPEVVGGPLPEKGVYFFFDPAERTAFSKELPRLVRIGTHGVSAGSKATLRNRLRTHLGTREGTGNHRGSVFRLHVGQCLIARDGRQDQFPGWGKGQSADRATSVREETLEREVSTYLARLQVLYLPVDGDAGKFSMRGVIENHMIALMTENKTYPEIPSKKWLGRWSSRSEIASSGLWNVRSVGAQSDLKIVEVADRLRQKLQKIS